MCKSTPNKTVNFCGTIVWVIENNLVLFSAELKLNLHESIFKLIIQEHLMRNHGIYSTSFSLRYLHHFYVYPLDEMVPCEKLHK